MVVEISLIIPVYNKAPFLKRCFDSVVDQVSLKVQVIVVDDGSTDGSGEICDEYSDKFEVYHIVHGGVSKARNYGLSVAKGKYVAFLDADDFLSKEAFKIMLCAAKSNLNIYQFGQYRLRNLVAFDERLVLPYKSLEGRYTVENIPRYWVHVWDKIYKREFLDKNEIRFRCGMQFGEDTIFNAECILINNGFYHAPGATVYHIFDDPNSLCRGSGLNLKRIERLDDEMCKLYDQTTLPAKKRWLLQAINQHRNSKLYRKFGFNRGFKGSYDVVYLVKETSMDPELGYSLRSLDANFQYKGVWFAGGCPEGLRPDRHLKLKQVGLNKWEKVRNMLFQICKNDEITEDFWLFNDDFYILKRISEDMPPQYNGELMDYIERIERRQGGPDGFTIRLRELYKDLIESGLSTLNYEVHKPMLLNRKKLLEVLEKFPNTPGFRSLYGNYWKIGGQNQHDMKIKVPLFRKIEVLDHDWEFVSTSDSSFREGNVGEFIRNKFKERSRFEI